MCLAFSWDLLICSWTKVIKLEQDSLENTSSSSDSEPESESYSVLEDVRAIKARLACPPSFLESSYLSSSSRVSMKLLFNMFLKLSFWKLPFFILYFCSSRHSIIKWLDFLQLKQPLWSSLLSLELDPLKPLLLPENMFFFLAMYWNLLMIKDISSLSESS